MTDTRFINNQAFDTAGAINVGSWSEDTVVATNVTFDGNIAGSSGGAIVFGGHETASFTATGGLWVNNQADSSSVISVGSNIWEAAIVLDSVTLHNNVAQGGWAVAILEDTTLDCTACDWGYGATDNAPGDLTARGISYDLGTYETFSIP